MTGVFQWLEWAALDYGMRSRPAELTDDRILVVGINEQDITNLGYPIPNQRLTQLLQKISSYQPNAIGLDIVRNRPEEPGYAEFLNLLKQYKNIVAIEKTGFDQFGSSVSAPVTLPPEQVGFGDLIPDRDGSVRRLLLWRRDNQQNDKFALSLQLTQLYLKDKGLDLTSSPSDPIAMQFGSTELTRFRESSGGYVGADDGGNQILFNFRSGRKAFQVVSLGDVMAGKVPAALIRDRIILVGMTAPSVKDVVKTTAIDSSHSELVGGVEVYGVEIHAHAVSQIISSVLDGRSLLNVLPDGWEYIWIISWGILGMSLGRIILSPFKLLVGLGILSVLLVSSGYLLLLAGWWIPVVPALFALVLNGAGLTASLFYRYQQDLKARVQARQSIIDQTFNAIHNGPLQVLAGILRETSQDSPHHVDLQRLDQELRTINEFMRREALSESSSLYLNGGREIDLQTPIHEILCEICDNTLKRDFPHFKSIQLFIPAFSEINEQGLTLEHRKGLCCFLEESLCNVGKHAKGTKRLKVFCCQEQGQNVIRVIDDGWSDDSGIEGQGTQQAKILAKQLGGKFRRLSVPLDTTEHCELPSLPKGMICELRWSAQRQHRWRL
jgi:CHASE2 domain-containing sensor protein/two-component sensor histidine kinase